MSGEVKRVLVTGAASGIGRCVAHEFARDHAQVIAVDRTDDEAVLLASLGQVSDEEHGFFQLDVSRSDDVERTFAAIYRDFGDITTLVNCAGVREISSSLELPLSVWQDVLSVNLGGTFFCSQAAANGLLVDGGSIVNVSSVAGLLGIGNRPAYTASKHGIIGLTRCFAKDLASRRIRVNVVCPGLIRTPMTEVYFSDEAFVSALPVFVPLGRAGDPIDVANAILFLASDRAQYITGVALPIDGGWAAEKGFSLPSESSAYTTQVIPS